MREIRLDGRDLPRAVTARSAAGLFGLSVLALGVAAVFASPNAAGATALIAVGTVALAFALFGDRIQTVAVAGTTVTLRDAARETLELADAAQERGEDQEASSLREVGRELRRYAAVYRVIRSEMPAGPARTRVMDDLMDDVTALGARAPLQHDDVARWFEQGTEGARITALGLMVGNSSIRDFTAAYDAIARSRSAHEQYWGLRLGLEMARDADLKSYEQGLLRHAVEQAAASGRVRRDPSRARLADLVLEALAARGASTADSRSLERDPS